ncbi:MAG: hypothetical protein R3E86_05935 [Pseudomonadales bacterium]
MNLHGFARMALLLLAPAASLAPAAADDGGVTADSFQCIRDMTPIRGFYVDNLEGDLEATLAVARSTTGGSYPPGSVVQLVPTEAMVKREQGFNPATRDWEFFELDVSPAGSSVRARGFAEVVNRFGGNCFACHVKARPEWDMVCEQDHGCDPIPLTPVMIRAIQKTDPRCEAVPFSTEEAQALQALMGAAAASGG